MVAKLDKLTERKVVVGVSFTASYDENSKFQIGLVVEVVARSDNTACCEVTPVCSQRDEQTSVNVIVSCQSVSDIVSPPH